MQFTKTNGAGNDFIILDGVRAPLDPDRLSQLARAELLDDVLDPMT